MIMTTIKQELLKAPRKHTDYTYEEYRELGLIPEGRTLELLFIENMKDLFGSAVVQASDKDNWHYGTDFFLFGNRYDVCMNLQKKNVHHIGVIRVAKTYDLHIGLRYRNYMEEFPQPVIVLTLDIAEPSKELIDLIDMTIMFRVQSMVSHYLLNK
jgi:hypothetical protein